MILGTFLEIGWSEELRELKNLHMELITSTDVVWTKRDVMIAGIRCSRGVGLPGVGIAMKAASFRPYFLGLRR